MDCLIRYRVIAFGSLSGGCGLMTDTGLLGMQLSPETSLIASDTISETHFLLFLLIPQSEGALTYC